MNKAIHDTWVIGLNELKVQLRNPIWLFVGLFQPVVYLVLFAPFLKGIASAPGFPSGNAIQFFAPGLLIMNVLFGSSFAGFGLINQLRIGVVERLRVTPASRVAIALGMVLRTPVVIVIQSSILVLVALLFGLKVSWSALLLLPLMVLIGLTMASLSFAIALWTKDEGTLAAMTNIFTLPLMLLSGIMLPVAFAPRLMQQIAIWDPFYFAVNASRNLMDGNIHDQSIRMTFLIFAVIGFFTIRWFVSSMKDAVA